jgi:hypothetical protein
MINQNDNSKQSTSNSDRIKANRKLEMSMAINNDWRKIGQDLNNAMTKWKKSYVKK